MALLVISPGFCDACGRPLAPDGVCENVRCQICGLEDNHPERMSYLEQMISKFILFCAPAISDKVQ